MKTILYKNINNVNVAELVINICEKISLCYYDDEYNKIESIINNNKYLHLSNLFVNKEFRRKNIANYLLKKAEKIAIKNKINYILLEVLDYNNGAISLYLKNDFINIYHNEKCEYFVFFKKI